MQLRRSTYFAANRWLDRRAGTAWPLAIDLSRRSGRRERLRGAGLLAGLLLILGGIPLLRPPTSLHADLTPGEPQAKTAPVPATSPEADATAEAVSPADDVPAVAIAPVPKPRSTEIAIARGDTLIDALLAADVPPDDAWAAATALGKIYDPRRLRVGQRLSLRFGAGDEASFERLTIRTGASERISAIRGENGRFEARREPMATNDLVAYAEGRIDDSLYVAADRAGVPAGVIVEMIRLFSFNVDFQREIRPGDAFALLYRRALTEEDGEIENGEILYARLDLSGREMALYRHRTIDDDRIEYFDADGKTARKALMKTPLDGARLTSRYGSRKHPVLGYVRAHRGLDFGAPTGTPVYAAGDGVIERASRYGSYGNYVRIRHNGDYKTAYAHLSKYGAGVRQGARVRQGQVIGYVGATGRVTGAHLHYEVLVNDEQVDPLKLKLPSGRVLAGDLRKAYDTARTALDSDIALLARASALQFADAGRGLREASSTAP